MEFRAPPAPSAPLYFHGLCFLRDHGCVRGALGWVSQGPLQWEPRPLLSCRAVLPPPSLWLCHWFFFPTIWLLAACLQFRWRAVNPLASPHSVGFVQYPPWRGKHKPLPPPLRRLDSPVLLSSSRQWSQTQGAGHEPNLDARICGWHCRFLFPLQVGPSVTCGLAHQLVHAHPWVYL